MQHDEPKRSSSLGLVAQEISGKFSHQDRGAEPAGSNTQGGGEAHDEQSRKGAELRVDPLKKETVRHERSPPGGPH